MISRDSKFRTTLYNIMDDLNNIPSAGYTMHECIQHRLDASYEQYEWTIKNLYNYVLSRSNVKVLRALSKVKQSKEKLNGNQSN